MAISKIKSDSIDTIAATKLTGTVDNARITLDAAEIPNLDAAKITTGDIANARIPASAVTQHVTATDMTPIENDLAVLALQNAVNSNITAHGLQNSWIEQFEDSNSIILTNCLRSAANEFIGSMFSESVAGTTFTPSQASDWALNVSDYTITSGGADPNVSNQAIYSTAVLTGDFDFLVTCSWTGGATANSGVFASGETGNVTSTDRWGINNTVSYHASAWYPSNLANQTYYGGSVTGSTYTRPASGEEWKWERRSGVIKLYQNNTLKNTYSQTHTGTMRVALSSQDSSATYTGISWTPYTSTSSANTTGSFTSTTITPQDSASKSSLGLVLLYKNNAGTNTLNSDIVAKVSADNGSNYSTCVLASKGTFSTGINIAIAPAISVTAGTQLKYKVEFANQASGSKEAQIHGVALQY